MNKIELLYSYFIRSSGVSTDTRDNVKDKIFFALSGANFNGNTFSSQAIENGAIISVIDDPKYNTGKNCFLVDNVLETFQELARYHRVKSGVKVLGITGSNGKTTTKELISSVLSGAFEIISTKGNLNNHIGVPLTLLSIKESTKIAVVEMGANHIGEIRVLCEIAMPDIGIITNIGKAHLEGFGSYQGVVTAKNELYTYLIENDRYLIVNSDDKLLMDLSDKAKRITYGRNNATIEGELTASQPNIELKWKNNGLVENCSTKIYGSYNFYNILAAIATGVFFNISHNNINQAIESFESKNNRSQKLKTDKNLIVLDAYNANPYSMKEAISSFYDNKYDNPWLLLGDMFELCKYSIVEHQKIVDLIKELNFKNVIFTGSEFMKTKDHNYLVFKGTDELLNYLNKNKIFDGQILIKGSRGMKMEKLSEVL